MANLSNINNKFLVTTGGDVGIGVTSPGHKLDVTTSDSSTWAVALKNTNANGYGLFVQGSETTNRAILAAYSGSSYKLWVRGDGNVGIGTVGPQALLDVAKDSDEVYDFSQDLGQRVGTATIHINNNSTTVGSFGQIMYDSDGSNQGIARIVFIDSGTAAVDTAFVNESNNTKIETLRIKSNGNIGIGTDSPSQKLEVNGAAKWFGATSTQFAQTGGQIDYYDTGRQFRFNAYKADSTGAEIVFNTGGTTSFDQRMVINALGNVGIGVTPSNTQAITTQITNGLSLFGNNSTPYGFISNNHAWTSPGGDQYLVSNYGASYYKQYQGAHSWATAPSGTAGSTATFTPRMTILQGGNVGIGTTTPGYPLEVNGRISISSATAPQLLFFEPGRAYTEAMRLARYEDKLSLTYGWNANEEALTVVGTGSTAGYVGIRTINPDSQLHVKGISTLEETTAGAGTQLKFVGQDNSGQFNFLIGKQYNVNNVFEITPSTVANGGVFSTPALVVNSSGKVGMGTTSPSEKLTIPGNYGVGLGYKTFYSSGGTVPAGIGPSYYLVATLNQLQGTTLTSRHQYKFFLTTTGTGTYNSSVYIVYANSNDTAWQVREVSRRGTVSNHPELTVSGTEARIYNDHPSSYGILYRVETTNSGQANTAPDIFGSDYMWQRTEDRLTYTDGVVGIGDTNPTLATRLVVAGPSGSSNVCDIRTGTTANTNVGAIVFRNSASAYCGQITVNGATAVTSYLSASDYRLKEDLKDFKGLDLVSNIKVYDYKWKSADERTYGVVAHELQEILPQAVDGNKDDEQMQGVDYSKIVPLLVKSIQELKAEIELLKSK